MKSTSFVLALAASANAIVVRDTQSVLSAISTISSDVSGLTTAVNAYSSIADAAGLISAESSLSSDIQAGTSAAKGTSGPISDADASSVLSAVKDLIPGIVGALNAVVAKDATFTSTGVGSVVAGDLTSLKSDTDAFAAALVALAPAGSQAAASAAVDCIDAAFASAIATKSADAGCTAGISIGAPAPTTSSGPTSSAEPTGSSSAAPSSTESFSTAPTVSASSSVAPTSTGAYPTSTGVVVVAPSGTASSYPYSSGGTYPTGLPYSNGGAAVKVGMSGAAVVAALAMVL